MAKFTKYVLMVSMLVAITTTSYFDSFFKDEMEYTPKTMDCPMSSQTCEEDKSGYAAIHELFSDVDTNLDGYITPDESKIFFEKKLYQDVSVFEQTEYADRIGRPIYLRLIDRMANSDGNVAIKTLWENWRSSKVYLWGSAEIISMLSKRLDILNDEYSESIMDKDVTGKDLPKFVEQNDAYLKNFLKIRDVHDIHKIKMGIAAFILYDLPEAEPEQRVFACSFGMLMCTFIMVVVFKAHTSYRKCLDKAAKNLAMCKQQKEFILSKKQEIKNISAESIKNWQHAAEPLLKVNLDGIVATPSKPTTPV